jgi:opacity protein-like surface antigen
MKLLLAIALVALGTTAASAQLVDMLGSSGGGIGSNSNSHSVQPYIRQNGTYVGGHQATNPNNTTRDNFGTRPNVNPLNGAVGTRR